MLPWREELAFGAGVIRVRRNCRRSGATSYRGKLLLARGVRGYRVAACQHRCTTKPVLLLKPR
jgi:hypothetical protein